MYMFMLARAPRADMEAWGKSQRQDQETRNEIKRAVDRNPGSES